MSPRQKQDPIEGFPPPTHITFTGTGAYLDGLDVDLGQAVTVTIKGTVILVGTEAAPEGIRPVVKVHADLSLGGRVRQLRRGQDLTQQQLATDAGIALRTLVNVEQDEDARISTVQAIADALGIDVRELFMGKAS
jgi:DNA-binding XRE family transcriptional regulator